jgi:hypothetical protein
VGRRLVDPPEVDVGSAATIIAEMDFAQSAMRLPETGETDRVIPD